MAHIVCNSNEGIVILMPTVVNYSHGADYIFHFDPLRSVRIFRVSKIVRLEPSSEQCFNYLAPFRHVSLIQTSTHATVQMFVIAESSPFI